LKEDSFLLDVGRNINLSYRQGEQMLNVVVLFALWSCSTEETKPVKSKETIIKGDGYQAILIPKGRFEMGCSSKEEKSGDCRPNETPSHNVTISHEFYLMKNEVTQELYQQIVGSNPSYFVDCGPTCPVENVNWYDAVQFANLLSKKEGLEGCYLINADNVSRPKEAKCLGWRLPTEAEWEHAARGPTSERYLYAGSNDINEVAWYKENSSSTAKVCTKKENGFGLCDMTGNVFEWCYDWYGNFDPYSATDPQGAPSGFGRVDRGGAWTFEADYSRLSRRDKGRTAHRANFQGFRLSRTSP